MSSDHLKRLVAPRSWNIARKENVWTTRPMPGKHSLEGAIPISTILRDYLQVCDNNREAKIILHAGDVFLQETGGYAGLQIRGSKFQSLNSNSRELELTNLLGLVLGCIEAKFCK